MRTRKYRTYTDLRGRIVTQGNATHITTSVYEVIDPDGTESLIDEWDTPIDFDTPIRPDQKEDAA